MSALSSKRVWSLWEVLKFEAHSFVECLNEIARLEFLIQDRNWLDKDPTNREYMKGYINTLLTHLETLQLKGSCKKARTIGNSLSRTYQTPQEKESQSRLLERYIAELRERLEYELEGVLFYSFSAHTELLDAKEPLFGRAVADAFPKAAEDIAEAGNCLALNRPTACVFHLMRAMERAVQALYTKLGLTKDPEREWGKLLSDIDGEIEKMPKGDDRNEWSAAHTHLYHVKQSFRNDTMHPKQTYTPDEAKAVFDAVRSFMQHLAKLVV